MIRLEGKRAVVTGAASGIGKATALRLAEAGADVGCIDLPGADLASVAAAIAAFGRRAMTLHLDVGDSAAVDAAAAQVADGWGGLEIWVNCASQLLVKPFLDTSDAEWRQVMETNLYGYRNGCRSAVAHMLRGGGGHIVNVASVTAIQPLPNLSAYISAKGGVVALTKALAVEFAGRGICVNAISPGVIETPMNSGLQQPAVRDAYCKRIATGRLGQPDDIADVILFLASDLARYICGQDILVDGGLALNGLVDRS